MSSSDEVHVLFVDDDRSVRSAFRRSARGCRVVLAKDPREALREAQKERFHLVAVDYGLPSMNGLQLIEELAKLQPNARFILVTGAAGDLPAFGNTVSEVISKPWDPAALQDCLRGASDS